MQVRISKGIWMAATECTQGQWEAVMGSNPSKFKGGKDLPVERVSWEDCQSFITKLNSSTSLPGGLKFALPTEAQWEYACRAGTESVFAFGDTLTSSQANFNGNYPCGSIEKGVYLEKTSKVGSYNANAWGLHDMHGNAYEWCMDAWDGSSKLPGGTDPLCTLGSNNVLRGGSWAGSSELPDGTDPLRTFYSSHVLRGGSWDSFGHYCRSAFRYKNASDYRYFCLGFRLAAVPVGR